MVERIGKIWALIINNVEKKRGERNIEIEPGERDKWLVTLRSRLVKVDGSKRRIGGDRADIR